MPPPPLANAGTFNFLVHFTASVRAAVDASQAFTTFSVIPGGATCDATQVPLQVRELLGKLPTGGTLARLPCTPRSP